MIVLYFDDSVRRGMAHMHTPEARAKSTAALTGRKQSPEQRAVTSAALAGKPKSAAHRRNLSLAAIRDVAKKKAACV